MRFHFPGSSDTSFGPVGSKNHTDKPVGLQLNSGFSQNCHDFPGDVKPGGTASPDIVSNTPFLGLNDGSEPKILIPLPPGRSPRPSVAHPTLLPVVPGPMPAAVPSPPPVVGPLPPAVPPPAAAVPPPPPPVKPPIKKAAPPPPAPRPPLPNQKPGAQMPPPPPKAALPPRQLQGNSRTKKPLNLVPSSHERSDADVDNNGPKTKLKPFFWDKVQANSQSNVWSHIKSGSFQ